MSPNVILAVTLSMITFIIAYIIWYLVRKKAKATDSIEETEKTEVKEDHSKDKKSYCYPWINDMMGFEFISVVRVPEELTRSVEKTSEMAENTVINLLATTDEPSNDENDVQLPDDPNRKENEEDRSKILRRPLRQPANSLKDRQEEAKEEYDVVETNVGVNPYELQQLDLMAPWTDRDYDNEQSDDMLDAIIRNNPDMIDMEGADEAEAIQIGVEQKALHEHEIEMLEDAFSNRAEANAKALELINKLGSDAPDENDIPEI